MFQIVSGIFFFDCIESVSSNGHGYITFDREMDGVDSFSYSIRRLTEDDRRGSFGCVGAVPNGIPVTPKCNRV